MKKYILFIVTALTAKKNQHKSRFVKIFSAGIILRLHY